MNSDCRPPQPLICPSYTHVSWFVVTTFSCVRGSQPSLTAKAHFSAFVTSRLDSCSALEQPSSKEKVPSKEKHFQINLNFHSKSYTHFSLDDSTGTKHKSASVIVYEVTQGRYTKTHSFCLHQDMKNHQSQQNLQFSLNKAREMSTFSPKKGRIMVMTSRNLAEWFIVCNLTSKFLTEEGCPLDLSCQVTSTPGDASRS